MHYSVSLWPYLFSLFCSTVRRILTDYFLDFFVLDLVLLRMRRPVVFFDCFAALTASSLLSSSCSWSAAASWSKAVVTSFGSSCLPRDSSSPGSASTPAFAFVPACGDVSAELGAVVADIRGIESSIVGMPRSGVALSWAFILLMAAMASRAFFAIAFAAADKVGSSRGSIL